MLPQAKMNVYGQKIMNKAVGKAVDKIQGKAVDTAVQTALSTPSRLDQRMRKEADGEAAARIKAMVATKADRHGSTNALFEQTRISRLMDQKTVHDLFKTAPESFGRSQSLQKEAAIAAVPAVAKGVMAGVKGLAGKFGAGTAGRSTLGRVGNVAMKGADVAGTVSSLRPNTRGFSQGPQPGKIVTSSIAPRVAEYFEKKAYLPEAYRKYPELLKSANVHAPRPAVVKNSKPPTVTTGPDAVRSNLAGGSA
jgi:hypothetical protein